MSLLDNGYEIIEHFLEPNFLDSIKAELVQRNIEFGRGGIRNAEKKLSSVKRLLDTGIIATFAQETLKKKVNFVRAIIFNKSPENNWLVSWHQDKTISVSSRIDVKDWGPWSIKDGIHHVQPSIDVMNHVITIRLHIDAATKETGCLRVIPESHLYGILSQSQIANHVNTTPAVDCVATSYSALIMHPLILHASRKAESPCQRRVLHVEYCSYELPNGLNWA